MHVYYLTSEASGAHSGDPTLTSNALLSSRSATTRARSDLHRGPALTTTPAIAGLPFAATHKFECCRVITSSTFARRTPICIGDSTSPGSARPALADVKDKLWSAKAAGPHKMGRRAARPRARADRRTTGARGTLRRARRFRRAAEHMYSPQRRWRGGRAPRRRPPGFVDTDGKQLLLLEPLELL